MVNVMIQAIQTTYKGYRFRSRLEARWAAFFDSLGLKWQYESEGFDLDGIWYLPDFWIEDWNCFVEIKPYEMDEDEFEKCRRLFIGSQKLVLVIQGDPWPDEYFLNMFCWLHGCEDNEDPDFYSVIECEFGRCRKCDCLYFIGREPFLFAQQLEKRCCDTDKYPIGSEYSERLTKAFKAARAARFDRRQT